LIPVFSESIEVYRDLKIPVGSMRCCYQHVLMWLEVLVLVGNIKEYPKVVDL